MAGDQTINFGDLTPKFKHALSYATIFLQDKHPGGHKFCNCAGSIRDCKFVH